MTSKLRDLKTEETIFFSRYLILGIKVLFNEHIHIKGVFDQNQ
jgi:hypothetical protein